MSNPFSSTKPGVSSRFVSATTSDAASTSAPEPDYDPRTLYERLKTQKDAKTAALDEKFKLSNQFRGIDESEASFLAEVQHARNEQERSKQKEEMDAISAFRKAREGGSTSTGSTGTGSGTGTAVASPVPPPPTRLDAPVASSASPPSKKRKKSMQRGTSLGVVRKKVQSGSSTAVGSTTVGGSTTAVGSTTTGELPKAGVGEGAGKEAAPNEAAGRGQRNSTPHTPPHNHHQAPTTSQSTEPDTDSTTSPTGSRTATGPATTTEPTTT